MANSSSVAGRVAGAALVPVLIAMAGTGAASEVRCVRGDDAVRRVVVEAEDPNQGVPCEVVYWKDSEQPGVRNVLWNAQIDAAFCKRKADELVDTLKSGGWSCAAGSDEPRTATRQPPPAAAAPSPPQADPAQAAAPTASAERSVAKGQPAAPATRQRTDAAAKPAPAVKEALAPAPPPAPAPADDSSEKPPAATALDAIIQQNLVRLNDGVDGKFAAEIGKYGDLNGDGLKDGLVFFTYLSDRLGQARFIAAYLFDGESYTLAATKPLAGSDDSVRGAEVESIENGVISLRLNILEPGDAACCPSGTRQQMLVLRGGQLVEARSASGTEGRS